MDKISIKFKGKVEGGKFVPDQPKAFLNYVKAFEGQEVNVTIKKFRAYKQRSNEQNRYYFGVCVKLLADEWGYPEHERDEVHELIKAKHLIKTIEIKGGKRLLKIGSTASLSTSEFEDYLSKVRMWASQEFNCLIPVPNEVPFEY